MCLIDFSKLKKMHVNFMKNAGKAMVVLKYKKTGFPLSKLVEMGTIRTV